MWACVLACGRGDVLLDALCLSAMEALPRQFMLSADCGTLLPFGGACPAVWYTSLSFPESARTAQL